MSIKEVCEDCGAPCKNRRKQSVVLCRTCWYARRSKAKADRAAARICHICGGPVSYATWYNAKTNGLEPRCRRCADADKAEKYAKAVAEENDKHPVFCRVCGKQIIRKELFKCKIPSVCSPECHGVLCNRSSVAARESKESLESRIIEVIKSRGEYTSLAELRKIMKISDKLVYRRGISIPELNLRAGVIDYLVDNSKTLEELEPLYMELIKEDRSISRESAAKRLGVSAEHLSRIGLSAAKLRKSLGLFNKDSKTRQEVIDLCVPWIKEQGVYVPFEVLSRQFHMDYKCALVNNDLTIEELNRLAGFTEQPVRSYWETYTEQQLREVFSEVVTQKSFDDLRSIRLLRFDFFLPEYNVLIEVDGDQHYDPNNIRYSEEQAARDRLKRDYVENNPELTLFRIPISPRKTFKDRLQIIITTISGRRSSN